MKGGKPQSTFFCFYFAQKAPHPIHSFSCTSRKPYLTQVVPRSNTLAVLCPPYTLKPREQDPPLPQCTLDVLAPHLQEGVETGNRMVSAFIRLPADAVGCYTLHRIANSWHTSVSMPHDPPNEALCAKLLIAHNLATCNWHISFPMPHGPRDGELVCLQLQMVNKLATCCLHTTHLSMVLWGISGLCVKWQLATDIFIFHYHTVHNIGNQWLCVTLHIARNDAIRSWYANSSILPECATPLQFSQGPPSFPLPDPEHPKGRSPRNPTTFAGFPSWSFLGWSIRVTWKEQ